MDKDKMVVPLTKSQHTFIDLIDSDLANDTWCAAENRSKTGFYVTRTELYGEFARFN